MVKRIEEEYRCSHVEADSRMLFHPSKCSTPSNIVIRTIDADVIIIALGSLHLLVESKQVWIETGLVTKNTLRYINIKQIHDHFGVGFCTAFLRFHAFSGCDYTASFNQQVNIRPTKLLEKNESVQQVFSKLHDWNAITEEDIQVVKGFVCAMYGKKRFQSVDALRLELFLKNYKPNNDSLVDKVRKLDSAFLPPCSRVLLKKLKRSSYIARVQRNCLNANPEDQDVLSFGWKMKDGH